MCLQTPVFRIECKQSHVISKTIATKCGTLLSISPNQNSIDMAAAVRNCFPSPCPNTLVALSLPKFFGNCPPFLAEEILTRATTAIKNVSVYIYSRDVYLRWSVGRADVCSLLETRFSKRSSKIQLSLVLAGDTRQPMICVLFGKRT